MTIHGRAVCLVFASFMSLQPLMAQQVVDPERIQKLEQALDELLRQAAEIRTQLDELKGPAEPESIADVEIITTPEAPAIADVTPIENQAPSTASKALNPDISVIGTMVGHAGSQNRFEGATILEPEGEGRAPFAFEEAEIAMEAFIDPYARGRFFLAIEDHGVELEEGYALFVTLPYGLTAKAGKVKALFGKANTWHTHTRPWVDQPLMIERFFGGHGLTDTGVSVSKAIDNPWNTFIEATGEVLSGDAEGVFAREASNDLFYNLHLKAFRDLSENSNIEIGTSWSRGRQAPAEEHEGEEEHALVPGSDDVLLEPATGNSTFAGVDVTYRWRPLSGRSYRSFIGRFEGLANRRPDSDRTLYGFYASADYQLARRWFAGLRVDRADRGHEFGEGFIDPLRRTTDRGISALITFWPSEFSQLRGQFRRTSYGSLESVNEFLIQLQFAIGAHGAHTF